MGEIKTKYLPSVIFSFVVDKKYGITVNFKKRKVSKWINEVHDNQYTHFTSSQLVSQMIVNKENWESYFLSMDFINVRIPDVYNTILHAFWFLMIH